MGGGRETGVDIQADKIAQSTRGDIMLFLLMQITIAAKHHGMNVGASNPWTEYVRMLPESIPVPTMWSEEERVMLVGTSLEVSTSHLIFRSSSVFLDIYVCKELLCMVVVCKCTCWNSLGSEIEFREVSRYKGLRKCH